MAHGNGVGVSPVVSRCDTFNESPGSPLRFPPLQYPFLNPLDVVGGSGVWTETGPGMLCTCKVLLCTSDRYAGDHNFR